MTLASDGQAGEWRIRSPLPLRNQEGSVDTRGDRTRQRTLTTWSAGVVGISSTERANWLPSPSSTKPTRLSGPSSVINPSYSRGNRKEAGDEGAGELLTLVVFSSGEQEYRSSSRPSTRGSFSCGDLGVPASLIALGPARDIYSTELAGRDTTHGHRASSSPLLVQAAALLALFLAHPGCRCFIREVHEWRSDLLRLRLLRGVTIIHLLRNQVQQPPSGRP